MGLLRSGLTSDGKGKDISGGMQWKKQWIRGNQPSNPLLFGLMDVCKDKIPVQNYGVCFLTG